MATSTYLLSYSCVPSELPLRHLLQQVRLHFHLEKIVSNLKSSEKQKTSKATTTNLAKCRLPKQYNKDKSIITRYQGIKTLAGLALHLGQHSETQKQKKIKP